MSEKLFYTPKRMCDQSECKKQRYEFNSNDWDIKILEFITGAGFDEGIRKIEVTKKKPKSELEWRDVTPKFFYELRQEPGIKRKFPAIQPEGLDDGWQNNYLLVQFRLESETLWWEPTYRTARGKGIKQIDFAWNTFTSWSAWNGRLLLASDSHNSWSAPVVVPIKFYEKLNCYVKEFNEKLNKEESNGYTTKNS